VHTSVIPVGGLNLTSDVATGLRTPLAEAERIKIKYGCAATRMIDPEETIEVPSVGGRPPRTLPREVLTQIIEPRVEEIFTAVHHELCEAGYAEMLPAGLVLCGGSTLLDGMPELGEELLQMPVRRGSPSGVGGLADVVKSPAYATAVGLVKYGAERVRNGKVRVRARPDREERRWGSRVGEWFREVF
jgi:cell division protein FtsA